MYCQLSGMNNINHNEYYFDRRILIAGFIFLHAIVGITYWWFAHILAIFWKIMFPFHARIHQDKEKYIHIVAVILGIIIPFVTPSFAFAFKGYSVNRYPPLLCLPTDPDVIYYGIVIPLSLTITIGMSQLIFVLHVVHKVGIIKIKSKN